MPSRPQIPQHDSVTGDYVVSITTSRRNAFIHLDENFRPWLDAMVPHIRRYLELLQLHTEHLGIFF